MSDAQTPLGEILGSLSGRRLLLVRPGGNWGDHLIWFGAEHLATRLKLEWRTVGHADFSTVSAEAGEAIYLHGGGGFTRFASGRAATCLTTALSTPGAVVIQGPCTIEDAESVRPLQDALRHMKAAHLFFLTRDRRSAEIAASVLPSHVSSALNEDTAFYLDREVLLGHSGKISPRLQLVAVREDSEAVEAGDGSPAHGVVLDPARFARSFEHWLRIHAAARTILTNRTHSAICGALLGTPTTMFAGAYHKNRSIWEFSLERRGVRWLADGTVPRGSGADPLLAWAPRAIRHSWKLNRLAKRLRGVPLS